MPTIRSYTAYSASVAASNTIGQCRRHSPVHGLARVERDEVADHLIVGAADQRGVM
jgi:hypothetical protein